MMIDDEFRAWQRDWQQLDASATMPRLDLSPQARGWVAKLIGGIKGGLPRLGRPASPVPQTQEDQMSLTKGGSTVREKNLSHSQLLLLYLGGIVLMTALAHWVK